MSISEDEGALTRKPNEREEGLYVKEPGTMGVAENALRLYKVDRVTTNYCFTHHWDIEM